MDASFAILGFRMKQRQTQIEMVIPRFGVCLVKLNQDGVMVIPRNETGKKFSWTWEYLFHLANNPDARSGIEALEIGRGDEPGCD